MDKWTLITASATFATQNNKLRLILDSRVLYDQSLNEHMQQGFASLSDVVNKLKETEV
jgi:hypothetical protein